MRFRLFALAGLTAGLIGLCAGLTFPFLPAITWGVALAILAWPMHRRIARHVASPGLAAGISAAVVVAVLLGSGTFIIYEVAHEAVSAAERARGVAPDILLEKATAVPDLEELLPVPVALERCPGPVSQFGDLALVELGEGDGPQVMLGHVRPPRGRLDFHDYRKNGTACPGTACST